MLDAGYLMVPSEPTSKIEHPASSIEHPVSGVDYNSAAQCMIHGYMIVGFTLDALLLSILGA